MTKSDRKLLNLFDFRETELESGVDPSQNLRSANKVSRIHDPNVGRHFSVSLSLLFLSFWLCCSSLTALSLSLRMKTEFKYIWRQERDLFKFKTHSLMTRHIVRIGKHRNGRRRRIVVPTVLGFTWCDGLTA